VRIALKMRVNQHKSEETEPAGGNADGVGEG